MPGVTSQQPPAGQCRAPHRPVALYRLHRVARTGGIEPAARAEQRRQDHLVEPDRRREHQHSRRSHAHRTGAPGRAAEREAAPRSARSRASANVRLDATAAAGRARTTTSVPAGNAARRCASTWRRRRLTRFRVTAEPTARVTTTPTRGVRPSVVRAACTTRSPSPRTPRAAWTAAVKSPRWRSRDRAGSTSVRPRAARAPWSGGLRGWRVRRGCACATGSRGSWPDDGCWAGTCACSLVGSSGGRSAVPGPQETGAGGCSCGSADAVVQT